MDFQVWSKLFENPTYPYLSKSWLGAPFIPANYYDFGVIITIFCYWFRITNLCHKIMIFWFSGALYQNCFGLYNIHVAITTKWTCLETVLQPNSVLPLTNTLKFKHLLFFLFFFLYCRRKRDEAKFSFHVHVDWAGGVKVGKDGKGLLKVWGQQLQQFRNVSPEIASAIVAQYPSPQLLLHVSRTKGGKCILWGRSCTLTLLPVPHPSIHPLPSSLYSSSSSSLYSSSFIPLFILFLIFLFCLPFLLFPLVCPAFIFCSVEILFVMF